MRVLRAQDDPRGIAHASRGAVRHAVHQTDTTSYTDDRWLAFDQAYRGGKTEYANNGWPGNNMFAVNQCTNIGA